MTTDGSSQPPPVHLDRLIDWLRDLAAIRLGWSIRALPPTGTPEDDAELDDAAGLVSADVHPSSDIDGCVRRVEAGAVLFNAWAFSFDARLDDLERRNRAPLLVLQELARHVAEFPLACNPA